MTDFEHDTGISSIDSELLRTLIDETVRRAVVEVRVPRLVPGTVISMLGDVASDVQVVVDGDTDPITTTSIIGLVHDGQRVMVMFYPPSGSVIIGYVYGT